MNRRALATFLATILASTLAASSAWAIPEDEEEAKGAVATPLEQAREESGVEEHPSTRHELPAGVLRLSRSELLAAARQSLELSVTLDRDVASGTLELTLPRQWTARSAISGLRHARLPSTGRGSSSHAAARRSERTVTFAFDGGRAGDVATFELDDAGIPAGTYKLPYRWREHGGASASGSAEVVFYAPSREGPEGEESWTRLASPGFDQNSTLDASTESETFVTAVPGNRKRFVVGANDGGQNFTKAPMPTPTDVPAEPTPETSNLCCDPMSAADAAGNIWYGGLSFSNGAGQPSRIVVARIPPGETSFVGMTVGLAQRTTGTQDKPLMTIDNAPSSPRFGRLYVVWDEPAAGGVNIVISQCDTRPGGVLNAANCDNADNWTAPVSVTPATGSYIYADVAASPDGTVNVVWWNYSAANAIQGDTCGPAANCATAAAWSTGSPQTIATLDATNALPIPFECPIEAQPGGRASTSPQVEVDRSGGANNGRVYVTWSDLRTGSGSTRCGDNVTPVATHLSWDSFVASKVGGLPGGAGASPTVATRLLTDGEGGGQASSDDWFAWLAVDQTTGIAWADFYSTRDDATRNTTNFYVRQVLPSGPTTHTLGTLTKVSSAASDYSTAPCCNFGNDYGDYTGIDATQGIALPVWSDKRAADPDGEAFTFVGFEPSLVAAAATVNDSTADNDGMLEPGEHFTLTQNVRNAGSATATAISSTLGESLPELALTQTASTYPNAAAAATVANATPFAGELAAEAECGKAVTMSLQAGTGQGAFTVPVSVPTGAQGAVQDFTQAAASPIPDSGSVTSMLAVSGVTGRLKDVDVRVNITHPFDGDLRLVLRAPDGTEVSLLLNRGASGDNFTNTDFDDAAATAIASGTAPFTGTFRPEQPLSALNGKVADGTWSLVASDTGAADVGTLTSWRLSLRGTACTAPLGAPAGQQSDAHH